MALLKEDGSLDIERINKLPIFEWMNLMGELTDEQFEEYTTSPLYENIEYTRKNEGCVTKQKLTNAGFISINEALNNLDKEFGL